MSIFAQNEKGCCFCGNPFSISRKTEEHVPPKWLLELAGVKRQERYRLLQRTPKLNYEVIRDTGAHSSVYGRVCKACNEGWLSDLEKQIKPIFEKMFSDTLFELDIHESQAICRWMHKTASLIALASPGERKTHVNLDDLRALCLGMLPSGNADVVVGRTKNEIESKLRIWTHAIRYAVPMGYSLDQESEDSKCFTAMLQIKTTLLGYIYRFPYDKWNTQLEPLDTDLIHIWPQESTHSINMASVSPIDDPEAIRFTFFLRF